jgi:hypothetical protein
LKSSANLCVAAPPDDACRASALILQIDQSCEKSIRADSKYMDRCPVVVLFAAGGNHPPVFRLKQRYTLARAGKLPLSCYSGGVDDTANASRKNLRSSRNSCLAETARSRKYDSISSGEAMMCCAAVAR